MAQISKGHQYEPSGDKSQVTAENLNDHVDKATLLLGCIKEQDWSGGANNEDEILVAQGESLVRISKQNFLNNTLLESGSFTFGNTYFVGNSVHISYSGFHSTVMQEGQSKTIFHAPAAGYAIGYGFGDFTSMAYSLVVSGQGLNRTTIGQWKSALIVDHDSKLLVHGRDRTKDFTPSGTIVAFAGINAPDGWLICDGRTLDATNTVDYDLLPNNDVVSKYYWLWQVLGTTYGGTGQSSFKIPDLRGEFIRGYDHNNGNDPRVFGSKQKDLLKAHKHVASNNDCQAYENINGRGTGAYNHWCDTRAIYNNADAALTGDGLHPEQVVNGVPTVGSETRPRNIALNYIIKI